MKNQIICHYAIVIITGLLFGCNQEKYKLTELSFVPWPQNIQVIDETIPVGNTLLLINEVNNSDIENIINTCINDFKKIGLKVNTHKEKNLNKRNVTIVNFFLEKDEIQKYGDEGYRLNVNEQISIYAATSSGLFWGTRTLLQLLQNGPNILIPKLDIKDQPVHGYRGLMIDVAREFHTLEFHLETIKKIASYKLNHYMIHFNDHQSYTLPSDIYPELPTPERSYSKEEIRILIDVAREYNITIVPSVDVPGHSGALIHSIPELKLDDQMGKLDITREETYEIIQNIFTELMELFPGPIWHLGADEVRYPDLADSPNDTYANWMKKNKLSKGDQLLNYFINRMYNFIKSMGYQMFVWEGFKPNIEPEVNREIIVCPFDIKFENIMPKDYIDAGYKILNTSWSPLYIAGLSVTTPETLSKWSPFMFGAGRSPQPFRYWQKYSANEISKNIVGAQMCSWENEEKAEWGLLFGNESGSGFPEYGRPGPRVQIFSERVWTGDKTSVKDLLERTGSSYWD